MNVNGLAEGVGPGDSVAVNGVCLTVSKIQGAVIDFDVSGETILKTGTGKLIAGAKVNLERAMIAGGRFGGHIVQGHVDGTGTVKSVEKKGQFFDVWFSVSKEIADEMVPKGSVAVNGISLTVAAMDEKGFKVAVIPTTWNQTTLCVLSVGDEVNIETDIIIKTIKKQLENIMPKGGRLTLDKLRECGF